MQCPYEGYGYLTSIGLEFAVAELYRVIDAT